MDIRQLRYFVAVAEYLNFGRAAQSLNMAQPPLSQQIRRLERILGMELFDRSSRRVTLTKEGSFLLDAAREVIGQAVYFEDLANAVRDGEAGELRIGFAATAMNWGLGIKLRQFRAAHPKAKVTAHQLSVHDQAIALQDGRIDLAFTVGGVNFDNLETIVLAEEPLRVVVPTDHRFADLPSVGLNRFADETFVGFDYGHNIENVLAAACYSAGFTPKISIQGAQSHTMIHMVSAGFGVTLLPACDERMNADGVVFLELEPPVPTVAISAIKHWRRLTPLAARMLEITQT
jgi:DNA-binding transcriptional LysR family regulator